MVANNLSFGKAHPQNFEKVDRVWPVTSNLTDKRIKVHPSRYTEIVNRYTAFEPVQYIADLFSVNRVTIWEILKRCGVPKRKKCVEMMKLRQNSKTREYHRCKRLATLEFLGSKCAVCGIDDIRVLEVDHINNDGFKDSTLYSSGNRGRSLQQTWLAVSDDPSRFQLLCANCHKLKTLSARLAKNGSTGLGTQTK